MSIRKSIGWTVESWHEKTSSRRGKKVFGTELTSVKRTVGYRWIDIGNIIIKLVLALGFIISMCTLSCSVQKPFSKQVEDDVRNFRVEIAQFQEECRKLLIVTNEIFDSYEKTVAFRKSVEEATREISALTNGVSELTRTFEFRLKTPLFAPLMFCPCCWRFYE